jgi:hypothetical protein
VGELIATLDAMGFVGEYWLADARFSAYDNYLAAGLSDTEVKAMIAADKKRAELLKKGNAINKAKTLSKVAVNF